MFGQMDQLKSFPPCPTHHTRGFFPNPFLVPETPLPQHPRAIFSLSRRSPRAGVNPSALNHFPFVPFPCSRLPVPAGSPCLWWSQGGCRALFCSPGRQKPGLGAGHVMPCAQQCPGCGIAPVSGVQQLQQPGESCCSGPEQRLQHTRETEQRLEESVLNSRRAEAFQA